MLFLWDNGGRLHHRSDPSQRLERAGRSSNNFATLVTCCLGSLPFPPIEPADDEQGSVAASEKAGLARSPGAAHVIAPVTDLRTLFRSIVPALPGPIGHPARPQCISFARGDRCLVGVKTGKAQCEHIFSALLPKADMRSAVGMSQMCPGAEVGMQQRSRVSLSL